MAKDSDKQNKGQPEDDARGHPFLIGCIIGLLIGIAIGWCSRPPSSFPLEDLKKATEEKFIERKDEAREELADFAENLAKKLRRKR